MVPANIHSVKDSLLCPGGAPQFRVRPMPFVFFEDSAGHAVSRFWGHALPVAFIAHHACVLAFLRARECRLIAF